MPHERSKQSKMGEAVVVIILGLVLMAFVHWGFGLVVFVGLLMLFSPTDVARGR
jgi:short subunit fatty acids transporter